MAFGGGDLSAIGKNTSGHNIKRYEKQFLILIVIFVSHPFVRSQVVVIESRNKIQR